MNFFKNHNNTGIGKWVFSALLMMFFLLIGSHGFSQIDSRNQIRPDRDPNLENPDKKTKRIKSKRSPRTSGKKKYSNKKQLKRSKRARAKKVDNSPKGDITGRRVDTKRTPRTTKAYSQPDPYKGKRIRTERSRAGPDAPEVRSATKRGERARTGDISGQKRVRQKSAKTRRPAPTYAQPNPYVGRKIRTEKSRAKSNTREVNSVRSASRPSESRKQANRPRAISATAAPKLKTKRNVYRNHERKGGEKSTSKDIAGKKIRTKNTQSAVRITGGIEFSNPQPYRGRKRKNDGERFKRSASRPASARSVTRKPETSTYKDSDIYSSRKNSRSRPPVKVKKAKSVRSLSQPSKKGERTIYGNKYSKGPTRSISGYSSARARSGQGPPVSLSGNRKSYRQKNTYKGKDRHFGENSSTKDIAGRRLRTRNYRSVKPNGTASGFRPYYGNAAPLSGKAKGGGSGARSKDRAGWNNGGVPVQGRGRNANSESLSGFKGRMPMSSMPSYSKGSVGSYGGNINAKTIRKYSGSREGSYRGNISAKSLRRYGASREGSYSGRIPAKSLRRYGASKEGSYSGNLLSKKQLKGGGSITKGWNNGGQPLIGKGRNGNSVAISGYKGKMSMSSMPSYGKGKEGSYTGRIPAKSLRRFGASKEGSYSGNLISKKPLKGGGSITKGWNNGGQPLVGKGQNGNSIAISGYRGKMPMSSMPSYSGGKEGVYSGKIPAKSLRRYGASKEASYSGRIKSQKPLKGGGSITRHWNNNGQPLVGKGQNGNSIAISGYRGKMPMSSMPSYGDGPEGTYSGKMKAKKPLKGAGGSITRHWNNNGQPIEGRGRNADGEAISSYQGKMKEPGKIKQAPGTERGRTRSFTFLRLGNPTQMGLHREVANKSRNNNLPDEIKGPNKLRMSASPGSERGRTKSLSFLTLGDPTHGGLHREMDKKSRNNNLPSSVKGTNRRRTTATPGIDKGRTRSFTFLKLGNPTQGGLHRELVSKSRNSSLPKEIKGSNRLRTSAAPGTDRGRSRSLSFIAIGNPTHGGFYKSPAQAKGRLHPSSSYTSGNKSRNSVEEKDQPIKIKIWWAKLFKKNANQPDSVKEKPKRPRFDKGERSIWETAERPDWYNNKR